jgi:biopolymer transport protein TolR
MAMNSPRGGRKRPSAEINITPFVDVILVLLIIFMVTAPMLISGIEVDLPKTKAGPIQGQDEPLIISVDSKGAFFLQEKQLTEEDLLKRLLSILSSNPQIRVFIKGDQKINYGKVIELFALVKEVGVTNVALVTEIDHRSNRLAKNKLN